MLGQALQPQAPVVSVEGDAAISHGPTRLQRFILIYLPEPKAKRRSRSS
jgi:hypothetical protein